MESFIGFLFLVLLGVAMLVSLFMSIVFFARLGEPDVRDLKPKKKRRPF